MEMDQKKRILMDAEEVRQAVERIADAVCDEFKEALGKSVPVVLLGIQSCGIPLSLRIAEAIREKTGYSIPAGTLDITMYRDDIGARRVLPPIRETFIPSDINDGIVILADDVLQTGRSIRAALDAVTDYGRPALIRLAILVDRGMREFPIQADYIGQKISAPSCEVIRTEWRETTGSDGVYAIPKK